MNSLHVFKHAKNSRNFLTYWYCICTFLFKRGLVYFLFMPLLHLYWSKPSWQKDKSDYLLWGLCFSQMWSELAAVWQYLRIRKCFRYLCRSDWKRPVAGQEDRWRYKKPPDLIPEWNIYSKDLIHCYYMGEWIHL